MNTSVLPKTLPEAKNLLSQLRVYEDMQKKLWKRWIALFLRNQKWEHLYKVEYHSSLWKQEALSQALALFAKVFSQTVHQKDIIFIEDNTLWGGMKLYFDDSLLDMSFQRVEKKFQK